MERVLAALAFSAASASSDGHGYRHHYGYHYGYEGPVFESNGNAYYGFPAPSYIHAPWPIYGYGPGYWGGYRYGSR
jgi:hypothetical protein